MDTLLHIENSAVWLLLGNPRSSLNQQHYTILYDIYVCIYYQCIYQVLAYQKGLQVLQPLLQTVV